MPLLVRPRTANPGEKTSLCDMNCRDTALKDLKLHYVFALNSTCGRDMAGGDRCSPGLGLCDNSASPAVQGGCLPSTVSVSARRLLGRWSSNYLCGAGRGRHTSRG